MKIAFRRLGLVVATLGLLLMVGEGAFAQAPASQLYYLTCGSGGAVRDPFGQCVRALAQELNHPECEPTRQPVSVEVPAPLVASLAADVNFDFDKSVLKPEGRASLDQLVTDMRQVEVRRVDLVGHTDSIGSEQYNQGLSERRAASVQSYLIDRGVNPALITASGRGELQPIASNATPEGRALNRRVDITVDAVRIIQQ
jgi:OOP family OmpA-OmpF porin